jgi:uncharacterized phage infection (PIP) family protein YhgE
LAFSIAIAVYGPRFFDTAFRQLDANLTAISANLETVEETFTLTKGIVDEVGKGLSTVAVIAEGAAETVDSTRPMLTELTQIVSRDVPSSLEAIESALPAMSRAAGLIEDTLTTLSELSIEQRILGIPIRFDLGLDYSPDARMDQSIAELGASLKGVPERLRGLEEDIALADDSLQAISSDVAAVSSDLQAIDRRIAEVQPLLDEYVRMVNDAQHLIQRTQGSLGTILDVLELGLILIMVWLALSQLVPLYLGWELATGRREARWRDDESDDGGEDDTE